MNKKILLMFLILSSINVSADLKFKNFEKKKATEIQDLIKKVPEIQDKKEIKKNPEENVFQILKKETISKKIKDSSFKIVDIKKLHGSSIDIHKKILVHVDISNKSNNIIKSDYILQSYYWYVLRKSADGMIKFIRYKPLNNKDFYKFNSYLKIEDNKIKLLSKKNSKFIPSVINIHKTIVINEINDKTFETNTYELTFKGIHYE